MLSAVAPAKFADRVAADIELWAPFTKEAGIEGRFRPFVRATRSNLNVRLAPRAAVP
jgi:hypothetical protein